MVTLIHRSVHALRVHDWPAAVIELVIVVLGIFLGLQADSWNDRRLALATEREYLSRLSEEVQSNLEIYRQRSERNRWLSDTATQYFDYLSGEGSPRVEEATLLGVFCSPGFILGAAYDNGVLDEMISAGVLANLQNAALRASIAEYRARQSIWRDLLEDSSDDYKSTFRFIDRYRQWRPATEESGFANCVIDFKSLESDPRALTMVASYQRYRFWFQLNTRAIAEHLERIADLLPVVLPKS
ncbi:hypothetical protein R0135_10095 [Congregibacter variabilis]|uniref:Uncharacterized protein n=1 Tax=Congregibacter variabilis TaxID=3081200 RepID=A0ABZ0I018_9GAMM|nr:hypothetical protein R0135_10095 [Congregibacter sp. IMCC43200]